MKFSCKIDFARALCEVYPFGEPNCQILSELDIQELTKNGYKIEPYDQWMGWGEFDGEFDDTKTADDGEGLYVRLALLAKDFCDSIGIELQRNSKGLVGTILIAYDEANPKDASLFSAGDSELAIKAMANIVEESKKNKWKSYDSLREEIEKIDNRIRFYESN
jgi:hypothetical protein